LEPGTPPDDKKRGNPGREPDGEGGEDDVEGDGERKLQPRKKDGIELHRMPPVAPRNQRTTDIARSRAACSGQDRTALIPPAQRCRGLVQAATLDDVTR